MIFKKKESKKKEPTAPKPINIVDVVKQAMVQVKYEEIGSWLATHGTPLFYAHKSGFSVVDQKFIDKYPNLKKELDKMVKIINKKKSKPKTKAPEEKSKDLGYIG